jgi:hypothetical protein
MKDCRGKTVVKARISHERMVRMLLSPGRFTKEQLKVAENDLVKCLSNIRPGTCYNLEGVKIK